MLKVGVTGGIGSGKTVVCKMFRQLSVPVFSADTEANKLITESEEIINKIKNTFGEEIYNQGKLDRKKLAALAFNDESALEKLNAIVHPAVKLSYEKWLKQQNNSKYIIKEAAILFETGTYKDLDYIVTVVAPEKLKIKRVMDRDDATREEVKMRMKNQMTDKEKIQLSDFVIYNDEENLVIPHVLKIHHFFLSFALYEK